MPIARWTREQMAHRVAQDIPDGAVVNLGVGLPSLVANHLPAGREVIVHSESGVLGIGAAPPEGLEDDELIDASRQPATLLPGGCFFDHAAGHAMVRGGHLDIGVLGASQVSSTGDLADASAASGAAMDLAIGAKKTFVMMEHQTGDGHSRIVERCTHPLAAISCVSRIYTDLAVIDVTLDGLKVIDLVEGLDFESLQEATAVPLIA